MNIAFLTYSLFSTGGVQRVVSVLASEMAKEHNITIYTYAHHEVEDRTLYNLNERVKVVNIKRFRGQYYIRRKLQSVNRRHGVLRTLKSDMLWNFIYFPRSWRNKIINVINAAGQDILIGVEGENALLLARIKDELNCKVIGWQHNAYDAYLEKKGIGYYGQDYLFDKYIPRLDAFVVLNEHDEESYMQKKGIKAITIHNPKSFKSVKHSNVNNKKFVAVGTFKYAKGFDLLIESFAKFANKNSDWNLVIYGDGALRTEMENLIHKFHMDARISLPGVTNNIANEMCDASALLLSSRYEGMPMVVLEALEVGLPIVAYDISAMIPLVKDGVEGIIVDAYDINKFADAMHRIANDETFRKKASEACRKKASEFDVDKIARQWEKLFYDVMN